MKKCKNCNGGLSLFDLASLLIGGPLGIAIGAGIAKASKMVSDKPMAQAGVQLVGALVTGGGAFALSKVAPVATPFAAAVVGSASSAALVSVGGLIWGDGENKIAPYLSLAGDDAMSPEIAEAAARYYAQAQLPPPQDYAPGSMAGARLAGEPEFVPDFV